MQGKVVFVGDVATGKTSILKSYAHEFSESEPMTVSSAVIPMKVPLPPGDVVQFSVWDTAGQEAFRSLVPIFVRGAEVGLVVFDLSDPATFGHVQDWMTFFDAESDGCANLILVGNKADLAARVTEAEIDKFLDAHIGVPYFCVSAKTGSGIDVLFQEIARTVSKSVVAPDSPIKLSQPPIIAQNESLGCRC